MQLLLINTSKSSQISYLFKKSISSTTIIFVIESIKFK